MFGIVVIIRLLLYIDDIQLLEALQKASLACIQVRTRRALQAFQGLKEGHRPSQLESEEQKLS